MTVAPWALVWSTGTWVQNATQYKSGIDADFSAMQRLAGNFAPQASPTPNLRVVVMPGFIQLDNVLVQIGQWILGTLTSTSPNITAANSIYGVLIGLFVFDYLGTTAIPIGTTVNATPSAGATTIVMTANATGSGTAKPIVIGQQTSALTAPVSNPRYDIVYVDEQTGVVGVVGGSENAIPVDPAIPSGKIPIARIKWTVGAVSITNAMLEDLRTGDWAPAQGYKGTSLASTASVTVGSGTYFHVTGTTGISSFSSRAAGRSILLYYEGIVTLTNGANLVLQGGVNRTTAAGDIQLLVSDDGTKWLEANYWKATPGAASSGLPFLYPFAAYMGGCT